MPSILWHTDSDLIKPLDPTCALFNQAVLSAIINSYLELTNIQSKYTFPKRPTRFQKDPIGEIQELCVLIQGTKENLKSSHEQY